ncbi:flagella synthesis protein FlgN [Marinobacterium litorale]|uniref:flagella synthesis protein FlgN n=1 Tax=Marinobacterium litorale TaxID=404770 RepID=UPI00040921D0|nr:flagellar protein FlgN [Marinobacterium litorale]
MSASEPVPQLLALIDQGTALLVRLDELLDQERRSLEKRDLEGIVAINEEKASLLDDIQNNFNARHTLLSNQGVALSAEGLEAYIASLPDEQGRTVHQQWQQLSQALEKTQRASLINQQLVRRGQENTDRMLSLLQGKNQKSELYGSSGQRNNFATQSRIGKA